MNQKKMISIALILVVLASLFFVAISSSDEEFTSTSQETTETTTEVTTELTTEPTTVATTQEETTTTEVTTTETTAAATTTTVKATTTTQATTQASTTKATTTATTTQKATTTTSSVADWVLEERAAGCSICSSKSCASLFATNKWGDATVDATLCSKYSVYSDPTLYCQTCGKTKGNGTNNTCENFLIDTNCDLCGAAVYAQTCHTCK